MAVELIGGAVVGAVVSELLSAVLEAKDKTIQFKSVLEKIKTTLESIGPVIEEIEKYHEELDRRKGELERLIEQMKEGKVLVGKCIKIRWWNCWSKPHYHDKLTDLDEAIERFFKFDLAAQTARDGMQTLVKVTEMHSVIMSSSVTEMKGLCLPPKPPEFTVGLDGHVEELKRRLLNGGVSVIVITATGGLGKTTLAKKLCWDEKIQGKFGDNIFYLTFSKMPNLKLIAQNLFQHKGIKVPEFLSDDDAVNKLGNMMSQIGQKPILLVLDDVWSNSKSIIEKLKLPLPDYKILVTSRLAIQMFGDPYYLKPLNNEDATTLLCHSASLSESDSNIPDKDIMGEIVKGCGGFPLALQLVGGSFSGQAGVVWQSRVMEWSKGHYTVDSDTDLLDYLEKLLDVLDTKAIIKECFLDLSLFPEDQKIPAAALIDMWVEFHKFHQDGVQAMDKIYELHTRNLAHIVVTRRLAGDMDKYYNDHFVTQHDLLRELAIKQSSEGLVNKRKRLIVDISGNDLPDWWTNDEQQKVTARILSITTDEKFNSDWCNIEPTETEVLVLNIQTKNYSLPVFMEKMSKVKVLILTNYYFSHAEFKNLELLGSLSNLRRMRLEKVSIPFFVQLENLRKLSLFMCNVSQAFENYSHQISDSLPNLVEINVDYCSDVVKLPNGLCDILSLRILRITNCHKLSALPEQIGDLENLEELKLNSCTDLEELPDSIGRLHKLNNLDICNCISLRKLPEEFGELTSLNKLYMRGCSRMWELPSSILDLENLKVVICDEETAALWEQFKPILENLKVDVPKVDINLDWLWKRHS
ncbi:Disease resistance protein [Quillaja saponaria]|uniref:Disease resistance protein n=1 Tax=Quillaja saponaria TaxID=32244 RepID=A0AAD7LRX1_QUISA|nr:Disease resistance protein [Quillaja saponaria]